MLLACPCIPRIVCFVAYLSSLLSLLHVSWWRGIHHYCAIQLVSQHRIGRSIQIQHSMLVPVSLLPRHRLTQTPRRPLPRTALLVRPLTPLIHRHRTQLVHTLQRHTLRQQLQCAVRIACLSDGVAAGQYLKGTWHVHCGEDEAWCVTEAGVAVEEESLEVFGVAGCLGY